MNEELAKKVARSIRLIQQAGSGGELVEVAYSGGKDSDVILELTRMSGINYRAIYKNTTIDPVGTLKHVKENGVEVVKPQKSFFQLVSEAGFLHSRYRFCCKYLKEYKILDRVIIGVRRAESTRRRKRYKEPTACLGTKKNHIEAFYPILDWSNQDVLEFVQERGIQLHPLYYRADGTIDVKRRLGCLCCPLQSQKNRIKAFEEHPNMVKAYLRAGRQFRDKHPDNETTKLYNDEFEHFYRNVFCSSSEEFEQSKNGLFGGVNYKEFLERKFNCKL